MSFWSDLSGTSKVASSIAAFAGAVVMVGTAWTMLDLPVFATRNYVDTKDATIVGTVIELAKDQRERLKRSRDAITARLTAATNQQSRDDLQALVEQANQDIADVDARIATLERMRGR